MSALWATHPLDRRALVLVFADRDASMWSSRVNELVGGVEDRLGGGYVTYALLNGHQPTLVDALTAARFAGCSSAVVALVGEAREPSLVVLPRTPGEMPLTVVSCDRSVDSVVGAFGSAALAEPAACA